jgi:NADPH:quinone reductase-like Zn-dependent oxidoreductase
VNGTTITHTGEAAARDCRLHMEAAVYTRYGPPDVVQITDVDKPVPEYDEVLIKVRAAALNPVDLMLDDPPYLIRLVAGVRKPKNTRVGRDLAGRVEAVGKNVTQFKPGGDVFGLCPGSVAEFVCASESKLATKPDNITFEQAASVPIAALTALQGLRDSGKLQRGQKVLINGASGGVGTFAVQIAKSFGAEVTAVCSARNVELVRSIGANRVIDYTREDFTKTSQQYDLIFDLAANHSLRACRRRLAPSGIHVVAGIIGAPAGRWIGPLGRFLRAFVMSRFPSGSLLEVSKILR